MQPYHGSTSLLSSTPPAVSYYSPSSQIYHPYFQSSTYPSTDYFQPPTPTGVFYTNVVVAAPVYLAPMLPTPEYAFPAHSQNLDSPCSTQPLAPRVKSEAREIIITQLSPSTTDSDLENLLIKCISHALPRSSTEHPPDQLEGSYLASHSDGRLKGHAFAIFKTEELARAVVKKLDGIRFQERTLKAHLTKESVLPPALQTTAQTQGYQSQTSLDVETFSHLKSPVGSSSVRTTTSAGSRRMNHSNRKSKESSNDRRKTNSPVVVNGSSSGSARARKG